MQSRNADSQRQATKRRHRRTTWQVRRATIARLTDRITQLQRAQVADPRWLLGVLDELLAAAESYLEADRSRAGHREYHRLIARVDTELLRGPSDVDTIIHVATLLAAADLNVHELLANYSAATRGTEGRIP